MTSTLVGSGGLGANDGTLFKGGGNSDLSIDPSSGSGMCTNTAATEVWLWMLSPVREVS